MLSYRHSYHAGNFADVFKHLVLIALLEAMNKKDKPYVYIDSHSGSGLYDLTSESAQINQEYKSGVGKLLSHNNSNPLIGDSISDAVRQQPLLQRYLELIAQCRSDAMVDEDGEAVTAARQRAAAQLYPGSPLFAQMLVRDTDTMVLLELHNQEINGLRHNFQRDDRVHIHHRDAYEGVSALVPPEPRRGLLLVDPSYEKGSDYEKTVQTLKLAQSKWETGVIALWLPLLAKQRDRSDWMKQRLARVGWDNLLWLQMAVKPQQDDFGMHGSAMLIANPPWQVAEQLEPALKALAQVLCEPYAAGLSIEWLKKA